MQYQYCMQPCLSVPAAAAGTWQPGQKHEPWCPRHPRAVAPRLEALNHTAQVEVLQVSTTVSLHACWYVCGSLLRQGRWQQGNPLQLPEPKTELLMFNYDVLGKHHSCFQWPFCFWTGSMLSELSLAFSSLDDASLLEGYIPLCLYAFREKFS